MSDKRNAYKYMILRCDMTTESESSDEYLRRFGSGLCYSLALFLAREPYLKIAQAEVELMAAEGAIRFEGKRSGDAKFIRRTLDRMAALRWLSAASGPIRNLQIPSNLPTDITSRLAQLKSKCYNWTFPSSLASGPSNADVAWAIDEAKELIRAIDEFVGVRTVREDVTLQPRREPAIVFRDN